MATRARVRTCSLTASVCLCVCGSVAGATVDARSGAHAPSPRAVAAAINRSAPHVAQRATDVRARHDADSAIVVTTSRTSVTIPKDPRHAATMTARHAHVIAISIDSGEHAGNATKINRSTVVYHGTDVGASTAVQAMASGGLRFMTIISGPEAPCDYSFDMGLPSGAKIVPVDDGGLRIVTAAGSPIWSIEAPWAADADGRSLPVSYSTDRSTLTMHVNHRRAAYPVVADPVIQNDGNPS
jgi:hypothetical protein